MYASKNYLTIVSEKQMIFCIPKWRVWSLLSQQEELLKLNKKKSTDELRAVKKVTCFNFQVSNPSLANT